MTECPTTYTPDQPELTSAPMSPERLAEIRALMRCWSTERRMVLPGGTTAPSTYVADAGLELLAEIDRLAAENAHLEGWGQNTMDGCVGLLARARDALYGVLAALGLGYGASALLDELDEAVQTWPQLRVHIVALLVSHGLLAGVVY